MTVEKQIDDLRARLKAEGHSPAPLVRKPYLKDLILDRDYFTWYAVPPNVRTVLVAQDPLFVLDEGGGIFLLRNAHLNRAGHVTGRVLEVNVRDYGLWSIKEVAAEAKETRKPVVTEMVGGICTECYFSNAPCGTHKI